LKTRPLIAVVDDAEPVRVAMRRLFRSARLDVAMFPSGAAFLESLKSHQPDCVVLDIHMPEMDGFAVQARLMQEGICLPIVIAWNHLEHSEARAMDACGIAVDRYAESST
jgi:two-component system response regulator FixJ